MNGKNIERVVTLSKVDTENVKMVLKNIFAGDDIGPDIKLYLYISFSNGSHRVIYCTHKIENYVEQKFIFLRTITRANCAQPDNLLVHLSNSIINEIKKNGYE